MQPPPTVPVPTSPIRTVMGSLPFSPGRRPVVSFECALRGRGAGGLLFAAFPLIGGTWRPSR